MMRSLFSGVSGLRNHQTRMDVIGNNISNVNTVGFKASRAQFQDVLSQTVSAAAAPQGNRGGTNPMQVGLGMGLASIDTIFTDGSFQPTGKDTDLSIKGQGFFVLADGSDQIYTRAGNFDFDTDGNFIVPGTGYKVKGWVADNNGVINTATNPTDIQIQVGKIMPARASTTLDYANNLSADDPIGSTVTAARDVYDTLGNASNVKETFTKVGEGQWLANVTVPGATGLTNTRRLITFDSTGKNPTIQLATPTPVMPAPTPAVNFYAGANYQLDKTLSSVHSQNITVLQADGSPRTIKLTYTADATTAGLWNLSVADANDSSKTVTITAGAHVDEAPAGTYTFTGGSITYTDSSDGTTNTFTLPASVVGTASGTGVFANKQVIVDTVTPANGLYTVAANANLNFTPPGGGAALSIALDMATLTQFGGESTIQATATDGYAAGTLDTKSIDTSGIIVGKFTNGKTMNLGQVALATFNNPGGLTKVGDNLFAESNNSGSAQVGTSGTGGRGSFNPGSLEMANVDLANEFSNMIITQRGFQANSKIITVTDEMLQDLANLKR
jgi:flagellar hook protein FlgE